MEPTALQLARNSALELLQVIQAVGSDSVDEHPLPLRLFLTYKLWQFSEPEIRFTLFKRNFNSMRAFRGALKGRSAELGAVSD